MMKKIILCVALLAIGASCSKNDDNNVNNTDPVFDAPYEPLKSFSDVQGTYKYVGVKFVDQAYSEISDKNCLSNNQLQFFKVENTAVDSISFRSFIKSDTEFNKCDLDFSRMMRKIVLQEEGKMSVDISTFKLVPNHSNPEAPKDTVYLKVHYKGNLEIGHQAGYLRIEDKFSKYAGKDKAYQYFKKI